MIPINMDVLLQPLLPSLAGHSLALFGSGLFHGMPIGDRKRGRSPTKPASKPKSISRNRKVKETLTSRANAKSAKSLAQFDANNVEGKRILLHAVDDNDDEDWGIGRAGPSQLFPSDVLSKTTALSNELNTFTKSQLERHNSNLVPNNASVSNAPLHQPQLRPTDAVVEALMALTVDSAFVGNCIAVTGQIVLTAGHHFNSNKDDPSRFAVVTRKGEVFSCEYALKNTKFDVAIFWVTSTARLPCVPLRGFRPPVGCQVATVWLNMLPPHHDLLVTPAVVMSSEKGLCQARGSVTVQGSSGAPVVDSQLGRIVLGIHLSSNKKDGSRISEFVPTSDVLAVLAEGGISLRKEEVTYPT